MRLRTSIVWRPMAFASSMLTVMPVCHPTRITLLTGQYPYRLGHPVWGSFPRDAEQRTLPALLKKAGYATAIAGKWQLTLLKDDLEQPRRMGFDK